MFKSVKDFRRRTSQSILATVGSAETTKDEVFDVHIEKFEKMFLEMNELGAAVVDCVESRKKSHIEAEKLSVSLAAIYQKYDGMEDWPDVDNKLKYLDLAKEYERSTHVINANVLGNANAVLKEAIINLESHVSKIGPEIKNQKRDRLNKLVDYDAHRRRLKEKSDKRAALESTGKGGTPAATELDNEISKSQAKVQTDHEEYVFLNEKTKGDIIEARSTHDGILDDLLASYIICEVEYHLQTASQLEQLLCTYLPENKVKDTRIKIHRLFKAAGIQPISLKDSIGSTVYSTGSAPVSSSVSSSTQRQSVPVVPSINTSTPSSLPSVPTASSVSFDNKRHSTGSTTTTNPPPALYPAVSPTLSSSVSSASDYDLMNNNPMAASKATVAPSHRASMPVTSSVSASNPFGANPFGVSSTNTTSNPFGQATTAPSALSTASHLSMSSVTDTNKRLSVRALYDHEAEEEDELNFKAGDAVEVVEKLEGGWWRGSCRGKEGLFPSNYVQNP